MLLLASVQLSFLLQEIYDDFDEEEGASPEPDVSLDRLSYLLSLR